MPHRRLSSKTRDVVEARRPYPAKPFRRSGVRAAAQALRQLDPQRRRHLHRAR